jgi:hypothetical protein
MLSKVIEMHVLPIIVECDTTIMTFEFWIFRTRFYTFILVINFIDDA